MNNYLICTAARSGKSWIAETLYWLGLGYGLELLTEFARGTAPGQDQLRAAFDCEGMAGLARSFIDVDKRNEYPCTGVSLQWTNLSLIDPANRASELIAFIKALQPCTLIFLRRRDTLSQAISHYIMMKSGYCHSTDFQGRKLQRAEVRYDRGEINSYLEFTERSYLGWHDLFAAASLTPYTLYYEDLIAAPLKNLGILAESIANHKFSNSEIVAAAACQSKVSDSVDKEFRVRYLTGN